VAAFHTFYRSKDDGPLKPPRQSADAIRRTACSPSIDAVDSTSERLRRGGHVGIVLPCFNEEENVDELYERVVSAFATLPDYTFEMLFIDNASSDRTVERLRALATKDQRVRIIVNSRNFGQIRSPFHGIMESGGDCVIAMSTDLQDPPELIPRFLEAWENGASVAVGQKRKSAESPVFWLVRTLYYRIAKSLAEVPLLEHVTGFGLYDRRVVEIMRTYQDPYPYVRGLICDIGLPISVIQYDQPLRKRGLTKNNFFTLFDMAVLGITSHSKAPLRLATIAGFALSALSLLMAILFLVLKLMFWNSLASGYAPAVISIFFLASVQIFLIGLVGEYLGAVLQQVRHRPMVVERERYGGLCTPSPEAVEPHGQAISHSPRS
jgi:glycosyltransferase involved in cell wall biosynthesis